MSYPIEADPTDTPEQEEPRPAEALVLHFDESLPVEMGVLIRDRTQSIIIGHKLRTRERPNSLNGTSHDRELLVIARKRLPVSVRKKGREPLSLMDRSRDYSGQYRQYIHPASQALVGLTIGAVEVSISIEPREDGTSTMELGVDGELPMAHRKIVMDKPYVLKQQLDLLERDAATE